MGSALGFMFAYLTDWCPVPEAAPDAIMCKEHLIHSQFVMTIMLQDVGMLLYDYLLQGCHKIAKRSRGTFGSYLYMALLRIEYRQHQKHQAI